MGNTVTFQLLKHDNTLEMSPAT